MKSFTNVHRASYRGNEHRNEWHQNTVLAALRKQRHTRQKTKFEPVALHSKLVSPKRNKACWGIWFLAYVNADHRVY